MDIGPHDLLIFRLRNNNVYSVVHLLSVASFRVCMLTSVTHFILVMFNNLLARAHYQQHIAYRNEEATAAREYYRKSKKSKDSNEP